MFRRSVVFLILWAGLSCNAARAGVVTFWYLGAPGEISNTAAAPADRIRVNTGFLKIDTSFFVGGLANRQLYCNWRQGRCDSFDEATGAAVVDYGFDLGTGSYDTGYTIDFDGFGNISTWRFTTVVHVTGAGGQIYGLGGGSGQRARYVGENYVQYSDTFEHANVQARSFLTGLGYVEGTPDYQALYCGSWADQACSIHGDAAPAWATDYAASAGGRWFTDRGVYDAALAMARDATGTAGSSPRSYYDIAAPAPVPVPLPLVLLATGIAAIAGIGRLRSGKAGSA